ncbi:hypothetical protein DPMN_031907 [Dreissena polymorpha]|uniref:Uncharacterized protein n=1 Tax=Dreissena polymorpha TaxID=45954 RepID=A0A9D4RJR9_DREPO|nr:hypothetical protein DPMN_031907 [Dreissena polymorpha]
MTSYVNKRYRMADHVQKRHFALDQAQFYYSLCMFRLSSREALNEHVTDYRRHAVMAAMQGVENKVGTSSRTHTPMRFKRE